MSHDTPEFGLLLFFGVIVASIALGAAMRNTPELGHDDDLSDYLKSRGLRAITINRDRPLMGRRDWHYYTIVASGEDGRRTIEVVFKGSRMEILRDAVRFRAEGV